MPELLAFDQGGLDYVGVGGALLSRMLDNGKLKTEFATRGIVHHRYPVPALIYTYLNQDNPVVGGNAPDKIALRRAIGLVRLSGDDRNDRDLRLVQGSALDRLLSDKGLRSRIASELAKNDVKDELTTEAQTALRNLDIAFKRESLPAGAYSGESCRVIRRNVYQSFRLNGATPSERSDAGVGLWINALVVCQSWWLFA